MSEEQGSKQNPNASFCPHVQWQKLAYLLVNVQKLRTDAPLAKTEPVLFWSCSPMEHL